MTLRWKPFERALWSRVAPHDARRQMTRWQRFCHWYNRGVEAPIWVLRALVLGLGSVPLLLSRAEFQSRPDLLLIVFGVLAWFVVLFRVNLLRTAADPEYLLLRLMPVSPKCMFRHWGGSTAGAMGVWSFCDGLLVYGLLAAGAPNRLGAWTGAVLGALLLAAVSLALTCLLLGFKIRTGWLALLSVSPLLLLYLPASSLRSFLVTVFYFGQPFGWVNVLFQRGWLEGNGQLAWLFLPLVALLATLPAALRRVYRQHLEGGLHLASAAPPDGLARQLQPDVSVSTGPASDLERTRLPAGSLTQRTWDSQGPMERLLARFLTERQKTIVEVLLPGQPCWTKHFLGLGLCLLVFLLVNTQVPYTNFQSLVDARLVPLFLRQRGGGPLVLVCLLGFLLWGAILFTRLIGLLLWQGTLEWIADPRMREHSPYRTHRLLPVSHWEVAQTLAKTHTVILLLLLPLVVLASSTPLAEMLARRAPHSAALLPRLWLVGWSALLLLDTLGLTPSLFSELKHWRSTLRTLGATTVLALLAVGWCVGQAWWLEVLCGAGLVLATLWWFRYSGALYTARL